MANKDKKELKKPDPVSFKPMKQSEPKPYVDKNVTIKIEVDEDVAPTENK